MMSKAAEILKPFRARIDSLDDRIVDLLVERLGVIREVAAIKSEHKIPVVLEDRLKEVIDRVGDRAGEDNEDMVCEIYALILAISCDLEEEMTTGEPKFSD